MTWRRPPSMWAQVGLVVLMALVLCARHWNHLIATVPLNDEISYMRAVDFVLAGESPYTRGLYIYPPLLAVVGAGIVHAIGSVPFLYALRALSYLGMATVVWMGLLAVPWRRWFLPAAIAFLCLAPAVTYSIELHNISPLIAGMTLIALWIWPRLPITAGVLLGLSAVLKPMVFLIPFLLLLHRPRSVGVRHRIAGAVGLGTTAVLLWLPPYLSEMFALGSKTATIPRSVSFHRLAYVAGWEQGTIWLSAAIALAAVIVVRKLEFGRLEFMVVAVTASLVATPILWSHTLVLSIPVQTMVLERLYRRRQSGRLGFRFEPAFVILAVAAIQLSAGASSVDDQGRLFQFLSTLPIAVAPPALAGYLLLTGGYPEPVEAAEGAGQARPRSRAGVGNPG